MLKCNKCGNKLRVTNTYNEVEQIVRRLICKSCGAVYKSIESLSEGYKNGKEEQTESNN